MELLNVEAEKLRTLVHDWFSHPEQELEATFGHRGQVSLSEFLRISQRLRSKGYRAEPQEDKLNIILPEHIRFTLTGLGEIQQYCRDNRIADKDFSVMIKDRTAMEANLDLEEYSTRVKTRRELELDAEDPNVKEVLSRWALANKAFRLIRRWTYFGKGFRIDMSMVRSTSQDIRRSFRWVKNFEDERITRMSPIYEVEVELLRDQIENEEQAMKVLVGGCGEILRGIQNHTLLIRKSRNTRVIDGYKTLVSTDRFRGVAPVTLEVMNMSAEIDPTVPNIRNGYNVTDKADGLRVLGYVDSQGELFMIDMGMNVYRTGLVRPELARSLVDGEWVTRDKERKPIQLLLLFDIYHKPGGDNVSQLPFFEIQETGAGTAAGSPVTKQRVGRWVELTNWIRGWSEGDGPKVIAGGLGPRTKLNVSMKEFKLGNAGDASIFAAAGQVLDKNPLYHTDGLIFTSNKDPLPEAGAGFKSQFKWKPAEENTVDFLVIAEKDSVNINSDKITVGVKKDTGETVRHKTLRLYVGSKKDPLQENPREAILGELVGADGAGAGAGNKSRGKPQYKPVLFAPRDYPDTMANYMYSITEATEPGSTEEYVLSEAQEPITDRCIVECRYDPQEPAGWRWKPMRIRHDKTERFQRGIIQRTLNADMTAESVWNSIHNPVTLSMIRSGADEPSADDYKPAATTEGNEAEVGRKYYDRKLTDKDDKLTRPLRDFHNRFIKEDILYKSVLAGAAQGQGRLIDVACGKAGDLQKWRRAKATFVLGIDSAGDNITNKADGAYRRYLDTLTRSGGSATAREVVPPMVFVIGDSSRPWATGDAGSNPQERDILRAVFDKYRPEGALPPFIEKKGLRELAGGANATVCMFALHYFFETEEKLDGLLRNISENTPIGGMFAGCCFDGEAVHQLLKDVPMDGTKSGIHEDTTLWTITKKYEHDQLPIAGEEAYGNAIDVEFVTLGEDKKREFLMPYPTLLAKMRTIGFEELGAAELKKLKLEKSTNLFEGSHRMASTKGKKYPMVPAVEQFSFLNRWFIFVRRGSGKVEQAVAAAEVVEGAGEAAARLVGQVEPTAAASGEEGRVMTLGEALPAPPSGSLAEAIEEAGGGGGGGGAGGAVSQERTIPAEGMARKYAASQVFIVSPDAAEGDLGKLEIGPFPGRYLHTSRLFNIPDQEDPTITYPSVEHFLAAMKYKKATNKPARAENLFGNDGEIHRLINESRLTKQYAVGRELSAKEDYAMMKTESEKVRDAVMPGAFKAQGATFDEGAWVREKDRALEYALRYRYTHDAKFRKAVDSLKGKGKYIINYMKTAANELGGFLDPATGFIKGGNKVGRFIMRIASYPPEFYS
jgi:hypothetical protein